MDEKGPGLTNCIFLICAVFIQLFEPIRRNDISFLKKSSGIALKSLQEKMSQFLLCDQPGCNRKYKTDVKMVQHLQRVHGIKEPVLPVPIDITKEKHSRSNTSHRKEKEVELAAQRRKLLREQQKIAEEAYLAEQMAIADRGAQLRLEEARRQNLLKERMLEAGEECIICLDEPKTVACVPCGHAHFCYECLSEEKDRSGKCPLCRQGITLVLKLY